MIEQNNIEVFISVIVPVYNAEKYLHRCVDSILTQTYSDLELLLIDDGSSDSSGKICDEYLIKDHRVKVFHKKNGGVSSARNLGLKYATGKWILFVDSDDYLKENLIREITQFSDNCSLLSFNWIHVKEDNTVIDQSNIPDKRLSLKEFWDSILFGKRQLSPWSYVYKSSIIKENDIRFNEKCIMSEDRLFNVEYFKHVDIVSCFSYVGYIYFDNMESVCNSKANPNQAKSQINVALKLCDIQHFYSIEYIAKQVAIDCLYSYLSIIKDYIGFYPELYSDIELLREKMKNNSWTINGIFWNSFLRFPRVTLVLYKIKNKITSFC